MGNYIERKISTGGMVLFLLTLFLLLFQPWQVGFRELYWNESTYAAQAMEVFHGFPAARAHGELFGIDQPLFPMLTRGLWELGVPMEFALRWLSLLPVLGIAIWIFMLAKSAAGNTAGGVATAVWLTSNILMEKATDGYPELAAVFFIHTGWFLWFVLGQRYNSWNWAWILAGVFAALAFYTNGFTALVYFIFPLIFMRRPLSIGQKLRRPGSLGALALVIIAILLWAIPYARSAQSSIVYLDPNSLGSFYRHIWAFPLDLVWRLLPWSLIAWPVLCAAYRPLDPTPIFSRFLRTLFIASFFLLWFSPFHDVREMTLVIPSLAILIGINYSLLIRRHGTFYIKIVRVFPYLIALCAMVTAGFFLIPDHLILPVLSSLDLNIELMEYRHDWLPRANGIASAILIFLIALYMLYRRKDIPLWVAAALVMLSPMLFNWSVMRPYSVQKAAKRTWAEEMTTVLVPEDAAILYKWNITGLYGECFYLGLPVQRITRLAELPADAQTVWLLATSYPQYPDRVWTLLVELPIQDAGLRLYRGVLHRSGGGTE